MVDPRGNLIQPLENPDVPDFYQYLSIDLSRFISPNYVPMGSEKPDPANDYLLTWTDLPYDTDYKLDYEQLEFGWYGGNIFRYYLTSELTDIEVSGDSYQEFELTPATNNFPIKIVNTTHPDLGLQGVNVTLYRYNYTGYYEEISNITDSSGIVWFDELIYDYNWHYIITHSNYYGQTDDLDYFHNKNYVDDAIKLIPLPPI